MTIPKAIQLLIKDWTMKRSEREKGFTFEQAWPRRLPLSPFSSLVATLLISAIPAKPAPLAVHY